MTRLKKEADPEMRRSRAASCRPSYNGYNGGRPSARLFGWPAADWSRPATKNSPKKCVKRVGPNSFDPRWCVHHVPEHWHPRACTGSSIRFRVRATLALPFWGWSRSMWKRNPQLQPCLGWQEQEKEKLPDPLNILMVRQWWSEDGLRS